VKAGGSEKVSGVWCWKMSGESGYGLSNQDEESRNSQDLNLNSYNFMENSVGDQDNGNQKLWNPIWI